MIKIIVTLGSLALIGFVALLFLAFKHGSDQEDNEAFKQEYED